MIVPDMTVPRRVCAQTRVCPDTIMSLVNNNIIIVSTRSMIMYQLDWWKHKHAQLLLAKRSKVWFLNYCSAITSIIPTRIFRYFILTCQGTNVSGLKCVWAQTCLGTNVCGHKQVWAQTCVGTNMSVHKRVLAHTCLDTNVSGHKFECSQTCLGPNVSRHKRVWAQLCGLKYVWAQTCGLQKNTVFSHFFWNVV